MSKREKVNQAPMLVSRRFRPLYTGWPSASWPCYRDVPAVMGCSLKLGAKTNTPSFSYVCRAFCYMNVKVTSSNLQSIFSGHNRMKLDGSNGTARKSQHNQSSTHHRENSSETLKYFQLSENKNTTHWIVWNSVKAARWLFAVENVHQKRDLKSATWLFNLRKLQIIN